ncbi:MAG: tRNA (N(6)-L-threonylcarbamoyladenosine(37)-C(2))-methylthiotransferase MtaB [Prevotellaceae bacterium]|jgi:threonylcarbamoyladenosine tRNA methylthiotransferase MtaB|nr:tRNA (N(6)-L-threonylcarbamoyladenosine(37)-C(2))-methylthiotransferase MtaB [Prevotellaceae bacterium]
MEKIKFYIKTIGCKLNFTESSHIETFLIANGLTRCENRNTADVFILNTCSVTGQAEKTCMQEIRSFYRENVLSRIIVTGCFANLNSSKITEAHQVCIISGTDIRQKREAILKFILKEMSTKNIMPIFAQDRGFEPVWSNSRTRCFMKIQDGCDNRCAYCTVHRARGSSRSASIAAVCRAVETATAEGAREIVLTGLNTADFGRKNGEQFIDLLQAIDRLPSTPRMRISSIEPNLLTNDIIGFIKESKHFMPHFHIPLQSGSDKILKLMGRRYSTDEFRQKLTFIKQIMPDAFIGTDMIAGMNGESAEDFADSFAFAESLPLSFIHVFPYSQRPNTKAVGFKPVVYGATQNSRVKALLELADKRLVEFYKLYIGDTLEVLVEGRRGDNHTGYTNNYIKTKIRFDHNLSNQIILVKLIKLDKETMQMKGNVVKVF